MERTLNSNCHDFGLFYIMLFRSSLIALCGRCSLTEVDWQYQIWKWGIIFTDNVCHLHILYEYINK